MLIITLFIFFLKKLINIRPVHIFFISLLFLFIECTPTSIHNGNVNSPDNSDMSLVDFTGFWKPTAILFHLYDSSDSIVFTNITIYDSVLTNAGIKKAFLHFKEDTLFENILYDSCCKESHTKVILKGNQIHYVNQPLLLSNPATGYTVEEFLFLKEKDTLQSTMVFYIDTLQEKRFKKSETSVLLTVV